MLSTTRTMGWRLVLGISLGGPQGGARTPCGRVGNVNGVIGVSLDPKINSRRYRGSPWPQEQLSGGIGFKIRGVTWP